MVLLWIEPCANTASKTYRGGGCFPPPGQYIAQNSKTKQAITLKLGDFSQISISKIWNSQIRDRPFVVAMATNCQEWFMTKTNKREQKLKLLPLLTESISSFEIFSEHLWLLLESKNSYLWHVTKLKTSSGRSH